MLYKTWNKRRQQKKRLKKNCRFNVLTCIVCCRPNHQVYMCVPGDPKQTTHKTTPLFSQTNMQCYKLCIFVTQNKKAVYILLQPNIYKNKCNYTYVLR